MQYFIDHKKKRVHQKQYAGDRCEFMDTPAEDREFSGAETYVEWLVAEKLYLICPHCRSLQIFTD